MTGGGRAEHVVSVMPRERMTSNDPITTEIDYRAVCTCNWSSNRFSTMLRGERAALMHRESVCADHSASETPQGVSVGTQAEEGA